MIIVGKTFLTFQNVFLSTHSSSSSKCEKQGLLLPVLNSSMVK
jgi:hypothetical protein